MARFKKDFDWSQIERDNQPEEEIIYVSKSEIKRDGQDYRKIAQTICELPPNKVESLGFDQHVVDAILQVRSLASMEAKRRQINFVSKQLRNYELEELDALLKSNTPTKFAGFQAQVDKRVRVTIARLQQPQFRDKTLELLSQQFPEFDAEYVRTALEEELDTNLSMTGKLYSYFFDLYRATV